MAVASTFIGPGVVFLLTLASGFWLSRSGKPLNTAVFTAHKLIALGAVIAMAVQTYNALSNAEAQAIFIAPILMIGLCVAALFASGALMSVNVNKSNYGAFHTVHRIATALAIIAGVALIYLLGSER